MRVDERASSGQPPRLSCGSASPRTDGATPSPSPVSAPTLIDDVAPVEDAGAPALTVGAWLRAHREQQGLGLDVVQAVTRIRAGQLRAIEEDRFDDLPGEAYARAFVRSYADHLGADSATATSMFNRQWAAAHPGERDGGERARSPRVAAARRSRDGITWAAAAAAILLVAASAAVLLLGRDSRPRPAAPAPRAAARASVPATATEATARARPAHAQSSRTGSGLVVFAAGGPCWVEARAWQATGPVLVMKTLMPGESLHLRRPRIWLRLGDPGAAVVHLNGRSVPLPNTTTPTNLIVTGHGVTAA